MRYEEAREYLNLISAKGNLLGLESIRVLLRELGNPQDRLKFIHVGGTNGKGSVAAYMEGALRQAGYKVGRYISPTLFSYEERDTGKRRLYYPGGGSQAGNRNRESP